MNQFNYFYFSFAATHVIKKKIPSTNSRKTLSKNTQVSCSDPDFLFKKMSKFIYNLYSETEAEYLKKRNISDKRVREILSPLSLVPNAEILMKHLVEEQEIYKPREFPKKIKNKKEKRLNVDMICENWEWKYKEVEYNREDILKEQQIPDEVVKKLRKGGQTLHLMAPRPRSAGSIHLERQDTHQKNQQHDLDDYLWQYFKSELEQQSNYEEIPIISGKDLSILKQPIPITDDPAR